MHRGIALTLLLTGALAGWSAPAHAEGPDSIVLRGPVLHGVLLEVRPHVLVRIRLDDGDEMTVPWSEVVAIRHAGADPPSLALAPRPEPPARPRHWYGWQTLLVDAGSLALAPLGVGIVTYALGPPVVHAAHGRAGAMLGSLLLRVGLPIVLAVGGAELGSATSIPNPNANTIAPGPVEGGLAGLVLGVVGAVAIDASVFAWEPGRGREPAKAAGMTPQLMVLPGFVPTGEAEHGRGGWLGVGGTF
jgi:hypothetical protein